MVRFLFLAAVFLLCVVSSYARTDVDVQAICKRADNPSFCLTLLKSKPGGPGTNLVDLEAYIFGVLRTDLSNTVTLVKKLIAQSGGDPKKQHYYKICLEYLGDEGALGNIFEGLLQLKSGDYLGVNVHMSAILTFVNDCLTDEDKPSKDTSLFPKDVDLVNQVTKIGLLISAIY